MNEIQNNDVKSTIMLRVMQLLSVFIIGSVGIYVYSFFKSITFFPDLKILIIILGINLFMVLGAIFIPRSLMKSNSSAKTIGLVLVFIILLLVSIFWLWMASDSLSPSIHRASF